MLSKKWLGSDTLRAMSEKYNALIDLLRSADEGYAKKSIKIVAGLGLKGGGNLEETRTLDVKVADSGILADSNGLRLNLVQVLNSDSTTQGVSARVAKTLNERIDAIARGGEARLLRIAETYDDTSYEVNLPSGQVLISVGKPLFRPKLFIDGTLIPSSWYTVDLHTGVFALSEPYSDSEKLPDFVAKCNILDGYPDALKFAYPTLDMLVASSDMASRIKVGDSVRILGENSAFDGGDCVVKCELTKGLNGVNIGTDLDPRWLNEVPNSKPKTLRTDIDRNTNDINYSQTPIGTVVPFVSDTIPLGWLPCDGREIKEADYPDLYKLLQFGRKVHITDEDIAKNSHHRVPTLKSNDDGQGYVVSASSEYSTAYQAWRAFDNLYANTNAWITTNGVLEGWLQIDYPNEVCIDSLDLTSRNDANGCKINYVGIQGIKADGTFVDLFVGQAVTEFKPNETRRFDCSEKRTKFKSFRVTVKTVASFAGIGELKLYTHNLLDEIPNEIANQDPTKKYLPYMNGMIPKGNTVGRDLGSYEFDAIRNIKGSIPGFRATNSSSRGDFGGAFVVPPISSTNRSGNTADTNTGYDVTKKINFDSSLSTLTSNENRPKNISFNYIIKASTVHNPSTAVDIADELNRKIEVNRNSIVSLDNKVDSYENRFDDVVLWEGLHQTNGTITLSEEFTNFREIEIIVSSYSSDALVNIVAKRLISKNVLFNDTNTADNKPNEYRLGVDSDGTGESICFKSIYFRLNKKDIYFGGRASTATISKITGIGRVK